MRLRKPSARWALWVLAAALLLKAAMPLLASASAQLQGKQLVEVCTVYGVAMVPVDGGGHDGAPDPGRDHATDHGSAHCGLSALATLSIDRTAPSPLLPREPGPAVGHVQAASPPPDDCAAWVAGLKHGPPALA